MIIMKNGGVRRFPPMNISRLSPLKYIRYGRTVTPLYHFLVELIKSFLRKIKSTQCFISVDIN